LILGVLYLGLLLGLSGCIETSSPKDTNNSRTSQRAAPQKEIPGVDTPGDPPEEIPGVRAPRNQKPTPKPSQAVALLDEAVDLETREIKANPPADADSRLELLRSVPSSPSDAVSLLGDYEWVSARAATKFDKAVALLGDG
jgi:hypothetical protein